MKARDIMSSRKYAETPLSQCRVAADMSVVDVIPRLLDASDRKLDVMDGERRLGVIDETSLIEGVGRLIAPRDDSSLVVVETTPSAYSASRIAQAVEDADTHLVDLWSVPGEDGMVRVTLRVRCEDPSAVVHSLERYDYTVVEADGNSYRDADLALERLLGLNALLNV